MPLSRMHSAAIMGLDAVDIEVEVDVAHVAEKRSLVIVGLPDATVKESKDRVLTAIKNAKFFLNGYICTVNLAPGNLRKEGTLYDLPIALGLLNSAGLIEKGLPLDAYTFVGELGFSGDVRPIQGALAIALLARKRKKKGIILPKANAREASAIPGIQVIGVSNLQEVIHYLKNPPAPQPHNPVLFKTPPPEVDFADVKGQAFVKRAAEIAAAGEHNFLLSGPPGSGKTMIAKALSGIMPPFTFEEALEITKIHSIAGMLPKNRSLLTTRPFRSPHHTVSYAGLIGGGTTPRPGEVSLAHNGILFLDELPEFSRQVLEVLRQPLEDGKVTISRANANITFPTSFLCVAAMNPCPCGYRGHPDKRCRDSDLQVSRYRSKISGPLLDRFDMHIDVPALRYKEMISTQTEEPSKTVQQRVIAARRIQYHRFQAVKTNSQMSPSELKLHGALNTECQELLRHAVDVVGISARACNRIIRVARTIADLANAPTITKDHMLEALHYRGQN